MQITEIIKKNIKLWEVEVLLNKIRFVGSKTNLQKHLKNAMYALNKLNYMINYQVNHHNRSIDILLFIHRVNLMSLKAPKTNEQTDKKNYRVALLIRINWPKI